MMENQPLVSVFMMTYNHEPYIAKALDSILMQKVDFTYEIVVGEDCSTDNTRAILINYANKNPNIFHLLLHEHNIGAFNNQNAVFKNCKGKYIAMLEGDDYWTDPYKLQKQVCLIDKHNDASMCVALIEKKSERINLFIKQEKYQSDNYPFVYFSDLNNYFHTSTYLIKTSILQKLINKYESLFQGDTALRYLLIQEGPFVVLNEHVSVYRANENGSWTSVSEFERDLAHYQLYSKFRIGHIPELRKHYARAELRYLHKVLKGTRSNKLKRDSGVSYRMLIKLFLKYDFFYPLKYFVKSLKHK